MEPFECVYIIGIAGGSGAGKTTFAHRLRDSLGEDRCLILSQDRYYIDQSSVIEKSGPEAVNFDHPSSLDFDLLKRQLQDLKDFKPVHAPVYCYKTHRRLEIPERLMPKPFILVEGTLILSQSSLLPLFYEVVYLDMPESLRFERRLKRDMSERKREPQGIRKQFVHQVKPMHEEFVEPTKIYATRRAEDLPTVDLCLANLSKGLMELR